ncbi:hypothetical protein ACJX0J_042564, partial [Zea mays]
TKGTPPLFREGTQVEVSRSARKFGKYWSPAIVIKAIGWSSFLVEYRDDGKDNGELDTEILDSRYIRPTRVRMAADSEY